MATEEDLIHLAEEWLADGKTISEVAHLLQRKHGTSETAAMAIIGGVVQGWETQDRKFSPYYRAMQRRRLMKMREEAGMKELVQIEKQLAELDKEQSHEGDEEEVDLAEAIASKSDDEIRFYEEHGYWPEEAPRLKG
jgi:hypothetical protein